MNYVKRIDPFIIISSLALSGVSLFLIATTAAELLIPQAISFVLGFVLLIIFTLINYKIWPKHRMLIYLFSLILLGIIFLSPGIRGAHRWLDIGVFSIQPSEILKPFIMIILSYYLAREKKVNILILIKPLLLFLPILILIFRQPDLGNFIVYLTVFAGLQLMAGLPIIYFIAGFIITVFLYPLIWSIMKDYQKLRLLSYLNPYSDPSGTGYNALQAMIAIGSGMLWGLGLGHGTQSRLLFLPEFHTDFIFASLGEELGFIGAIVILLLYSILLVRILYIGYICANKFGRLLCVGIFTQLFTQVFINIGMNLGLVPITGITLPLISYGGSSIISSFIGLGIVISVSRQQSATALVIK